MISRERLTNLCQWFKRKSFVICCGIAPVILLFALFLNCNFGCNVIVNGEVIGTAPVCMEVMGPQINVLKSK